MHLQAHRHAGDVALDLHHVVQDQVRQHHEGVLAHACAARLCTSEVRLHGMGATCLCKARGANAVEQLQHSKPMR